MATATKAKKAPAKKAPVKKAAAKKAAPKKAAPKQSTPAFVKVAERAVNVYLGVIGKSVDTIQANMESARKQNEKRVSELEKRGAKLRKDLEKRVDKLDVPAFDEVVEDARGQLSKVQSQVEEAVDNVKERFTTAKAA
jgi:DNA-directed RNA polymerase beta' subunit